MLQLSIDDSDRLVEVCRALSTTLRIDILKVLSAYGPLNIQEIAKHLQCPTSTISVNIKAMEEAGLIISDKQPAKNGANKICSPVYWDIMISLNYHMALTKEQKKYEAEILIGNFQLSSVTPSCGYVFYENGTLRKDFQTDDKFAFFEPERIGAQLLWFRTGYVEYHIPIRQISEYNIQSISFSLEICSEAPGYNNKWKSDITMAINDTEIGTWTSPADFGGRRGNLTPLEWFLDSTQYGILTEWTVNSEGTFVNDQLISDTRIDNLNISDYPIVKMRLGVKKDSLHLGGINIFGDKFGDYPQNINMTIIYA